MSRASLCTFVHIGLPKFVSSGFLLSLSLSLYLSAIYLSIYICLSKSLFHYYLSSYLSIALSEIRYVYNTIPISLFSLFSIRISLFIYTPLSIFIYSSIYSSSLFSLSVYIIQFIRHFICDLLFIPGLSSLYPSMSFDLCISLYL